MNFNPPGPMIDPARRYPTMTGCPRQEKTMPPIAAKTIMTTKSDINLKST
jgi:hypothetical protein